MKMPLCLAFLFISFLKFAFCGQYFIVPSHLSCPSTKSCQTLSQFADNSSSDINSNMSLFMFGGNHSLQAPVVIHNFTKFSMIPMNDSGSRVKIFCSKTANFILSNISNVHISGVTFIGCGSNKVQFIKHLTIEYSNFVGQRSNGTALTIINSSASLISSYFAFYQVGSYHYHFRFSRYLPLNLPESFSATVGGALIVNSTTLTIEKCCFLNNSASIGGAMFSDFESNITICNSLFSFNSAINHESKLCFGGALFIDGSSRMKIHNSTFNNSKSTGGGGIAVAFNAILEVSQSNFHDNMAERFAGVISAIHSATVVIDSSMFNYNRVDDDGGAIYADSSSIVTLNNSTFFNNSATKFGGILFLQSKVSVTIIGSRMQNNTAKSGGAIYATTSTNITINNSTFMYNKAISDFREVILNEGGVVLLNKNSIVNVFGSTFAYNRAGNGGGVFTSMESNDGGRSSIRNSTFICNMAEDYGGVVHLQYGSIIHVYGSNFENNHASLDGGVFDSFISCNVEIYHSTFASNHASLRGGVATIKERSNLHSNECVFYNNTGDTIGAVVYLRNESHLTTFGCNFSQNMANYGGVIVSKISGNLIAINCTFFSNIAKMDGGILYMITNLEAVINDSSFIGNIAVNDGVMMVSDNSTIVMNRCNFSGNEAGHDGGVAYAYDNSSIAINSCNTVGNRAGDSGGAIYGRNGCNIVINNSSIINCVAQNNGGSVFIQLDSNVTIKASKFTNSSANIGGVINAYIRSSVSIENCVISKSTASISGGVIAATENSSVQVQTSSFTFNSGGYGGISFAFQNSRIVFDYCKFFNNKAEFYGIIKIRQQCILTITKSVFENNTAENGAILYSQASNATIKESVYKKNYAKSKGGVIYGYDYSIFNIYSDTFSNNMAKDEGGVIALIGYSVAIIEHSEFTANRADSNGGIIFVQESSVNISDCTFNFSTAESGGIIYATHSSIKVNNSLFYGNRARESGGVIKAHAVGNLIVLWSSFVNNTVSNSGGVLCLKEQSNANINHSHFEKNKAYLYGGVISASTMSTVLISNSDFNNNSGKDGGAIAAQGNSTFSLGSDEMEEIDGKIRLLHNIANRGGGIYLSNSVLYFRMKSVFSYNQASSSGGGMYAINSSTMIESTVNFVSNVAMYGGGVGLANSKLYDTTQSTTIVNLIANDAADHGGALYIDDEAESAMCSTVTVPYSDQNGCFLQTVANHLKMNLSKNHANLSGHDLFGGLLDRCMVYSVPSHFTAEQKGVAYFKEMTNITNFDTVSSEPVRICLCNSNQPDCSQQMHSLSVQQGDTLRISVVAVDQVNHPVTAVVHSNFEHISLPVSQTLRKIGSVCSVLDYELSLVNVGQDYELTLYAEGPCAYKGMSKLQVTVNIITCSCAPGFMPADKRTECICVCDTQDKIFSQYIKKCNSSTESVIREGEFWITYLHDHNDSNLSPFFIFPYCPMDYCLPPSKSVSINFNLPDGSDVQCANERAGILCGSCQRNYSLSLGTSRCIKCPNNWYGQLVGITIAAFFGGIILVVVLLWLNLTVAVGTLNSIIFFANVIHANKSIYFSKTHVSFSVFVSWLNLDLGIDACFFEGMDTFAKTWLLLVFPAYLLFLVIVIICISSYSFKFSSVLGKKNPVETLATLILLSYTKLLETIITSLSFVFFKYPNGTETIQWLADASVDYGKGKHITLICVAVLILIIGFFYTVVIFSYQWLLRFPTLKWTNYSKLHIFIKTYHTPYTVKHRYWTGLLLLVRVIIYLITTFTISADPRITLLLTIIIISCLQMYKTACLVRVYRNRLLNAMESFVFFNIAIFTTITWYTFDEQCSKKKEILQAVASYISVGTFILSYLLVIIFHTYRYSSKTLYTLVQNIKLCKKLERLSHASIQVPTASADRESDVYQLFDDSNNRLDSASGYFPPSLYPLKQTTSSNISLADCEEL